MSQTLKLGIVGIVKAIVLKKQMNLINICCIEPDSDSDVTCTVIHYTTLKSSIALLP